MWQDIYDEGKRFFEVMKKNKESLKFLDYDSRVQFDCAGQSFFVTVRNQKIAEIKEGKHSNGLMDLILIADEKTFSDLFRGRISPANLLYHGKIRIPAQKGKHSLIAALFQAIRKNQEDLYKVDWDQSPLA